MCASSKPSARSASHFAGLAVANTSAPRCRASCTAAIPTPPAPACTSTRSPGFERGQIDEPVVGRQEHDRHRRRLRERPALRHPREQSAGRPPRPGRAARQQPHHAIARRQVLHPRADLQHHARALAAHSCASPGYMPSAISTSRKFRPAARTADAHLPRLERSRRLGAGHAARGSSSVPPAPASRRHCSASRRGPSAVARVRRARAAARATVPSRSASCGSPRAQRRGQHAAARASCCHRRRPARNRPGCSDCAERTRPHKRRLRQPRETPRRHARRQHPCVTSTSRDRAKRSSASQACTKPSTHARTAMHRDRAQRRTALEVASLRSAISEHELGRRDALGVQRLADGSAHASRCDSTLHTQPRSGTRRAA